MIAVDVTFEYDHEGAQASPRAHRREQERQVQTGAGALVNGAGVPDAQVLDVPQQVGNDTDYRSRHGKGGRGNIAKTAQCLGDIGRDSRGAARPSAINTTTSKITISIKKDETAKLGSTIVPER